MMASYLSYPTNYNKLTKTILYFVLAKEDIVWVIGRAGLTFLPDVQLKENSLKVSAQSIQPFRRRCGHKIW